MKIYLKVSKWLRWLAVGVFGLMLVLNVMFSLEFEKNKLLPSISLIELGSMAMAQSEDGHARLCDMIWEVTIKPGGAECKTGGSYKCTYCVD